MFFRRDKKRPAPQGQELVVHKAVIDGEAPEPGTDLTTDVAQRIYTDGLPFSLLSLPNFDKDRKLHLVPKEEAESFQTHLVFHATDLAGKHPPMEFYGISWVPSKNQTSTFWRVDQPTLTKPDEWHNTVRHEFLPPMVEFLNAQLVPQGYRVGQVEIVDRYRGEQTAGKQETGWVDGKCATMPYYVKASTRFSREDRRTYVFPKAAWEAALLHLDGYNTAQHRESRRN